MKMTKMTAVEKEFVPYELALELKQLGFNEPCFGYYKHTTIPNRFISNDLIIGFIKDNRIYNDTSNGSSLVGLGKGFILAPPFSQAFRWFREKYGWVAEIHGSLQVNHFYANLLLQAKGEVRNIKMCDTYEEAELACLEKLIEIVKNKKL